MKGNSQKQEISWQQKSQTTKSIQTQKLIRKNNSISNHYHRQNSILENNSRYDKHKHPNHKNTTYLKINLPKQSSNQSIEQVNCIYTRNKNLHMVYTHLCKQTYIGGANATFDEIANSSMQMSMNKWMIFCKEFDFTKTNLTHRQLIEFFKQATNNKSVMNYLQFCKAVQSIQQKLQLQAKQLLNNVMMLKDELSSRWRIQNFKINFHVERINFFEEATKLPIDKYYESKKEKKHLKELVYVPCKGMLQCHIKDELIDRKNQRIQNKIRTLSQHRKKQEKQINSFQFMKLHRLKLEKVLGTQQKFKRIDKSYLKPLSYSRIFKEQTSTQKYFSQKSDQKKKQQQIIKFDQISIQNKLEEQNQKQIYSEERNNQQQIKDFDIQQKSESQQSDEILKEHFNNEKKRITQSQISLLNKDNIMIKDNKQNDKKQQHQSQFQQLKNNNLNDDDVQTNLMITQNVIKFD